MHYRGVSTVRVVGSTQPRTPLGFDRRFGPFNTSVPLRRVERGTLRRVLDLTLALTLIVMLLPLLILISLLIKIQDGGPVLFTQERIGRKGARFRCHKFRSMRPDAEAVLAALLASDPPLRREWELHHKLKKDPRITLLGDFLRRSSLDELPQLFNILTGEMSIVGPRPIVEAEIKRYGRWYRYYTTVRPGLTGLWQVSGRSDVDYRRRVAMDRLYVRSRSLNSYVWILMATIPAVLLRRGSC
ncbi:MAG: sugar transferase [Caulobacteraceae bacterium]|nr:sugar transferase [Caulobacteraceae bacterium]